MKKLPPSIVILLSACFLMIVIGFVIGGQYDRLTRHSEPLPSGQNKTYTKTMQHFILEISTHETSRDSNTIIERFAVDGQRLHYEYQYDGHHPNPNFERSRQHDADLTNEELQQVQNLLHELAQGRPDITFPASTNGASERLVRVKLQLEDNKQQNISGSANSLSDVQEYQNIQALKAILAQAKMPS